MNTKAQTTSSLTQKNDSRSFPYKTTVSALLGLGAVSSAEASIIHFDMSHAFTAGGGSSANVDWNIDQTGVSDAVFSVQRGGAEIYISSTNGADFSVLVSGGDLKNLSTGYLISTGRSFEDIITVFLGGNFSDVTGFISGVPGYMGFKFNDGGGIVYGWANITLTPGSNGTFTVNEWAYQDDGSSIQVGATAVPEPEVAVIGLAGLALGAAGVRRWRKLKAQAA